MKNVVIEWSYPKDIENTLCDDTMQNVGLYYITRNFGGNISDLGGYYNELVYFCDKAKKGEKVEQATLCDGVASLEFLLKELSFHA